MTDLDRTAALLTVFLLAGCVSDVPAPASEEARNPSSIPPAANDEHDWFADRADAAGLHFVHFNGMSGQFYFPEIMPPGVGLFDYDNDGDLDVFLVQGDMIGPGKTLSDALFKPAEPLPLRSRLFRNDLQVAADGTRTLKFTDVTEQSGIDARGYGMGVATGDIDNDGWVDLFLTYLGTNQLYRNNGNGTFTDVSASSGIDAPGWGVSASFVDYDRDGWLDLYVGNYVQYSVDQRPDVHRHVGPDGATARPSAYRPQTDRLYHNRRRRHVRRRHREGAHRIGAVRAGAGRRRPRISTTTAGRTSTSRTTARRTCCGSTSVTARSRTTGCCRGAAVNEQGKPEASMGVDAGDFDNDGDEDLFMTHLTGEGSNLYVNDGSASFEDRSARSRLRPVSLGYTGCGTAWIDFDNDGWLDLLAVNGASPCQVGRGRTIRSRYDERNFLLRNTGDGQFEDVTGQAGAAFKPSEVGRGAAFGDIDNDGDTDVLIANLNGPVRLLVNNIGNRSHWMGLRLVGSGGRDMLGARVEFRRRDRPSLWRRVRSDGSYASANDPRVLVGLGDDTAAPTRTCPMAGRRDGRVVRCRHRSMDDLERRDRQAPLISTRLIVAVLCVAVVTGACSRSPRETPADSGNPTLAPPAGRALQPVPRPELSPMGEAVQQRIQQAYTALTRVVEDQGATPERLAKAYGEVGDLLMALSELESAEPYYLNAQTLQPGDRRWPYLLGHLYRKPRSPGQGRHLL